MFEDWGSSSPPAPGGDDDDAPGAGGVEAVVGVLSGMVPGAALAGVVERAVAPLLAPADGGGNSGEAGLEEAACR